MASFKDKYGDKSNQIYEGNLFLYGMHLDSLEGCYKEINGSFSCSYNNLKSLEGGPEVVHGNYYCYHNQIEDVFTGPKQVDGDFICHDNCISKISLETLKENINGKIFSTIEERAEYIKNQKKRESYFI